ncbi:MAG: hypothetical protein UX85_C0003G0096 [Candidatus Beckwithbacteria bacterium GW2011_GWB1_47_15]|uniref:Uncharacterized protein n=1 Tax=Candidatus Beckwithbacteria bacterium GW2011_GWB1_47_15 TaxID=1618371 RepID=A0A0G1RWB4_9BACT|nr:MAG: hypothetical protein UY43_C0001G0367 [Candidatus Beckwithbacteria bacterium GW2011_GWC1_49_16]KKU35342.1 MAG: hypothetical protein UX50_C0004G0073 [Candidatus Beckwithbacteria bacterium GW2011_GWA1_46_30]KKU61437.1 MAG: hypothetical protein UX85_C0003G0096 [Candidatus Beckwithbacteria bacterium GW2011_GWB1_47_15]KKU71844.1 MAG: hypothetical protein UX97_C0003G0073 [Candidatus Beckwithbacteria bacterium GW2011_GWA2_47_25]KKW03738.1 MAG: hypothetical protein UY37_C0004G0031 [Candidatus Be
MKTIVTHIFPDLDAVCAVWLLKRFDHEFEGAKVKFVPAGTTLDDKAVDSDPDVVHVDTGLGRFDHHDSNARTCAADLVFNYLKSEKNITLKYQSALERLIDLVIQIDHFEDFFWNDAAADIYDLSLHHLLDHLKMSGRLNDRELVAQGELLLEAVLYGLHQKDLAEKEIRSGIEFISPWGKSLGTETKMSRVSKLGQKMGFALIVRKEPGTGFVSVKCQPKKSLDLTAAYQALKQADPKADWFFHPSRHIILNGSRHNQKVKASSLNLKELVDLLKGVDFLNAGGG